MKLNNKAKRWIIVAGCALLCTVLIFSINIRFAPQAPVDEVPQSTNTETIDTSPVIEQPKAQEEKEVVIKVETQPQDASEAAAPAVSSGMEQTIQPDTVKQTEPEAPVAQGDYANPVQPPEYKPEDTTKQQSQPSAPKNGDTSDEKIYVDGFGWIENHGGGASGTKLNDMYENGNKIGQMG